MKIKGVEYPVSILKVTLHDETLTKLDWIKNNLKLKNDAESLSMIINSVYSQLKQMVQYYESNNVEDMQDKEEKPSEDSKS
jgi:hypothetical protein